MIWTPRRGAGNAARGDRDGGRLRAGHEGEAIGARIEAAQAAGRPVEEIRVLQDQLDEVTAEAERIASPIDTGLLEEGAAILDAAEDGTLPPTAPRAGDPEPTRRRCCSPPAAPPKTSPNPDERAAEAEEARTQSVEPLDEAEAATRVAERARAADRALRGVAAGAREDPAPRHTPGDEGTAYAIRSFDAHCGRGRC